MSVRIPAILAAGFLFAGLVGCHDYTNDPPVVQPPAPPPAKYSVGGTVTGLNGEGLTLESDGTTIEITAAGEFVLFDEVDPDTDYDVTITASPTSPHQICEVTNGSGTVGTADVTDIAVDCVDAVHVSALVTDAPIAFATVSIQVGDKFYTTVADENGEFALNIAGSGDAGEMVIAEATGAEGQEHVTFASILGTIGILQSQADEDGALDSEGNGNVNITNVSTARYVLVVRANDGEVPTDDAALQTAERSVNATELLNLAAAIKLIVDDPDNFELPAGSASILEFATNAEAVATFIAAAPPEAMEQALTDILADAGLVPGYKAEDVPGTYFVIPSARPGFLSPQGSGLVLNEDGTGEFLSSGSGGFPVTATLEWTVLDGIVKVIYDEPVTTPGTFFVADSTATEAQRAILQCQGITQVSVDTTVTERDYALLSAGSLVDQVRVTTLTETTFDPIAVTAQCDPSELVQLAAAEPTTQAANVEVWKSAELPEQPFTLAEMNGSEWGIYMLVPVGPYFGDLEPTTQFANMMVSFDADGTAVAEGLALDILWEISDEGALVLTYGEWTQEMHKLQVSGSAVKSVMVFQNTVDENVRFAYFDLAVKKDLSLFEDGAAAFWVNEEGKFWNAYTNGWSPGAWDGDEAIFGFGAMTFGWSFNEGGQAFNHQFFYDTWDYTTWINGTVDLRSAWNREMVWSVDEDSDTDGYIGFEGPYVNGCYNAVPQVTCYKRDWMPIGTNAAGYLYVNEQVWYSEDDGVTWGLWIAPRITPVLEIAFPALDQEGESLIQTVD